jgi:hypothetical protein
LTDYRGGGRRRSLDHDRVGVMAVLFTRPHANLGVTVCCWVTS